MSDTNITMSSDQVSDNKINIQKLEEFTSGYVDAPKHTEQRNNLAVTDYSSLYDFPPIYNNQVSQEMLKQFNYAIDALGINTVLQYFETLYENIGNLKVVSVGSGSGYVEKRIENKFNKSIICVDPKKVSTDDELLKCSQYNTVVDLLLDKIDLNSNCVLFLNWPTPCESTYDYEAIKLLNPNHVIIIFESTGSGGGTLFQKWLNYCGMTTDDTYTENDVIEHDFKKYNIVNSTMSRRQTKNYGMMEYVITWLTREPCNIEHNLPTLIGENIPRIAYNPVDTILDSLIGNLSEVSKMHGMSNYFEKIQTDVLESRYKNEITKQEKKQYDGYTKPHNILSDNDLHLLKLKIYTSKYGDIIECHHPFYRKMLREYASSVNCLLESKVVNSLRKDEDSTLLYHYACKKCSPVSHIDWYPDYSMSGQIYQMQANCPHCDDKILSDYKDDKDGDDFGYKYVRGKNALCVINRTN